MLLPRSAILSGKGAEMKTLIVSATHEPASFVASMARTGESVLQEQGHQVIHSDLYAMRWNPVAGPDDFAERANSEYLVYALEQRKAVKDKTLASDITAELNKLLDCDLLILNFPIYWFSVPAILKGWFDRVLVSGICYGGRRFYDAGGLKGRKVLVAPCIGGQEHMFGDGAIHGPIEQMLSPLLRGTLAYTGLQVLEPFIAWHVPYISDEARANMLQDYSDCLRTLDSRQQLNFPSLSNFDADMQPLVRKDEVPLPRGAS